MVFNDAIQRRQELSIGRIIGVFEDALKDRLVFSIEVGVLQESMSYRIMPDRVGECENKRCGGDCKLLRIIVSTVVIINPKSEMTFLS